MIPITVFLQTATEGEPYRQLFRQHFYEIPAVGSIVRVFVADRTDGYVVREVYHDFRSGPQGPSPLPVSIVVTALQPDTPSSSEGRSRSGVHDDWGNDFQQFTREVDSPNLG